MIDSKIYFKILKEGLLLDHYNILVSIRDGRDLPKSKRIDGFTNLLHKKGYIEDGVLTKKAVDIIGEKSITTVKNTPILSKQDVSSVNISSWVQSLHKKCEQKLIEITGKKQVRDSINGKSYSFLPNATDLGRILSRAIQLYKLTDYDKIERTILLYISKCGSAKSWFPVLQYYILKNNMSAMVTDMESLESDENEAKSDDTIVNI